MKIFRYIRRKIWHYCFKNAKLSYSQSGEDMILNTIFYNINKGTYIDVGANNPFVQSNTYYFYKKGWRGINIDALPNSMILFRKHRPLDINIERAISDSNIELEFYMFNPSFYNTFCNANIEKTKKVAQFKGTKMIKTIRLENLLDSLDIREIEFLTIDVEGLEYEVLNSNNWSKYRPKVIVIEYFLKEIDLLKQDSIYLILIRNGYRYFCHSITNLFFIEDSFYKNRFSNDESN